MKCRKCNGENPDGALFCMNCGADLRSETVTTCPQCGEGIPVNARFCPSCGSQIGGDPQGERVSGREPTRENILHRLAPRKYIEQLIASSGRMAGDRRVVSILFFDIKGSTAMAEKLDPEDVMEIMNDAFETLIEPIYRYEGTEARIMGDAVLAFFGAPISHEDDAARACHAALEIIDRSREYAERLDAERGIPGFDVRVGINTGLVVVGEVGSDLRVEYTAMGDAVNLAKRMESAAEPGTILITQSTKKLVSDLFDTKNLGRIIVKGKKEPVTVYRLVHVRTGQEHTKDTEVAEPHMIGRGDELSRLRSGLDMLREGQGCTCAIVGEAGLGKSRLIREARKTVSDEVVWIEGRCMSYARDVGCWIERELLQQLLDTEDTSCRETSDTIPPPLFDIQPNDGQTIQDHEQIRKGILSSFCDHIKARSRSQPYVLVWRDLQWIDPSSLEFLEMLVPLTDEVPLALILVFRPGEGRIRNLHERLREAKGECYEVIEMKPLAREDGARLLERFLDGRMIPEQTFNLILDHSGGNAFFMEEVVRSLQDSGLFDPKRDGDVTAGKIKGLGIPTTLQGAIMSHIDLLPPQDKQILQTASVLGRVFERGVLARTLDPPILDMRLEIFLFNLCRRGFLELRSGDNTNGESEHESILPQNIALWRTLPVNIPDGKARPQIGPAGARYYFKNPVMAEVNYSSLLKSQRVDLHRRAGEAIEALHPGCGDELAPVLAYHYEKGKVYDKAFTFLVRVARMAASLNAIPEAITGFGKAITIARENLDGTAEDKELAIDMGTIHEEFGDLLHVAGESQDAVEQYEQACELAADSVIRERLDGKIERSRENRGK
ncbi:MAG: AAA family ATPase [bacterium]|nr:MAG: AAA family ATPase [bacterium]